MKQIIRNNIWGFIIGGIIFSGITIFATNYNAENIKYGEENVSDALNKLYNIENNSLISLIPEMTSNTSPSGKVTASYIYPGRDSYLAFTGAIPNISTGANYWYTNVKNSYLQYEFENTVNIKMISFQTVDGSSKLGTFSLQISKDETTWKTIEIEKITQFDYWKWYTVLLNEHDVKYIRFTNLSSELAIGFIQAYGNK